MPDLLNKQAIVNLLIDSPLREPIKLNLIDIVNNTNEPDLPKVYSTITKELEIFQKATERRMKLAEETIAKLGGSSTAAPSTTDFSSPSAPAVTAPDPMPNLPTPPTTTPPVATPTEESSSATLPVAPLDLPAAAEMPKLDTMDSTVPTPTPASEPAPTSKTPTTVPAPNFQPLGGAPVSSASDEDALAEIQKELDSLKTEAAADVASAAAPVASTAPTPTQ